MMGWALAEVVCFHTNYSTNHVTAMTETKGTWLQVGLFLPWEKTCIIPHNQPVIDATEPLTPETRMLSLSPTLLSLLTH